MEEIGDYSPTLHWIIFFLDRNQREKERRGGEGNFLSKNNRRVNILGLLQTTMSFHSLLYSSSSALMLVDCLRFIMYKQEKTPPGKQLTNQPVLLRTISCDPCFLFLHSKKQTDNNHPSFCVSSLQLGRQRLVQCKGNVKNVISPSKESDPEMIMRLNSTPNLPFCWSFSCAPINPMRRVAAKRQKTCSVFMVVSQQSFHSRNDSPCTKSLSIKRSQKAANLLRRDSGTPHRYAEERFSWCVSTFLI